MAARNATPELVWYSSPRLDTVRFKPRMPKHVREAGHFWSIPTVLTEKMGTVRLSKSPLFYFPGCLCHFKGLFITFWHKFHRSKTLPKTSLDHLHWEVIWRTSFFSLKMKVIWFCLRKTISGSYLKQNNSDLVFQTCTIFLKWVSS